MPIEPAEETPASARNAAVAEKNGSGFVVFIEFGIGFRIRGGMGLAES